MKRFGFGVCLITLLLVPAGAFATPSNDDLADAITTGDPPFSHTVDTTGATTEPGEPTPCGALASTVWYRFTPTAAGYYGADTTGSDFDTAIAVYDGPPSNGTLVECNDDGYEPPNGYVEWLAAAGVTYYIQAAGTAANQGSLFFRLSGEGPPPDPPGSISGYVTNSSGSGIAGICVEAHNQFGQPPETTTTGSNGGYYIPINAGTYKVFFWNCQEPFLFQSEWYDDTPFEALADEVEVVPGEDTPDINAQLSLVPPPPDPAVVSMRVRNVPLGVDGRSTGVGWVRLVDVRVANLGESFAHEVPLTLTACPVTLGDCQLIGSASLEVPGGRIRNVTIRWNGLFPDPTVGDVDLIAQIHPAEDANAANNTMTVAHYSILGGSGFGFGVATCSSSVCPLG